MKTADSWWAPIRKRFLYGQPARAASALWSSGSTYYSNRRIGIGADSHMPAPRLLARRAQKKKAAIRPQVHVVIIKATPSGKKKGFVLYIKKR